MPRLRDTGVGSRSARVLRIRLGRTSSGPDDVRRGASRRRGAVVDLGARGRGRPGPAGDDRGQVHRHGNASNGRAGTGQEVHGDHRGREEDPRLRRALEGPAAPASPAPDPGEPLPLHRPVARLGLRQDDLHLREQGEPADQGVRHQVGAFPRRASARRGEGHQVGRGERPRSPHPARIHPQLEALLRVPLQESLLQ